MVPTVFDFSLETFDWSAYRVNLEGQKLNYQKGWFATDVTEVEPTDEDWEVFWEEARHCNVWGWNKEYYVPCVDGTSWSLHIHAGGRRVESAGSNGYPGSDGHRPSPLFCRFLRAVSNLLGGLELTVPE